MNRTKISIAIWLAGGSIFCQAFTAGAQESEIAFAHVKYQFTHVDDTNFRNDPHREEMMLYIGKDATLYNSFSLATTLERMKKEIAEEPDMAADAGAPSGRKQPRLFINAPNISHEALYLFHREKRATAVNKLGMTTYTILQPYPQIDWQIDTAVKEIGGYRCQQATGIFGGRKYTAWFTTELPFPYGPWKLQGLPGLILEAEDSKHEVVFRYAGFDKDTTSGIVIALPEDALSTSNREFEKAKAAFDKNPTAHSLPATNAPAGAQRKIVLKDQSGRQLSPEEFKAMREMARKQGKIKTLNNPLELPGGYTEREKKAQ